LPALAGIAFSLSWIVGLGLWSASTKVGMSGEEILGLYAGNERIALVQFAFTELFPALAFAAAMILLGRRLAGGGQARLGRVVAVTASAAAVLSLAQFGLGAYLCLAAAPAGDAGAAKTVVDSIGRTDGAKMLLMAAFSLAAYLSLPLLMAWITSAGIALSLKRG
jgi:hypothetical protein